MLREALKSMGREDLIGNGRQQLIPAFQPRKNDDYHSPRRKNSFAKKHRQNKRPKKGQILTAEANFLPK